MKTGIDSVASTAAEWQSVARGEQFDVAAGYWNGIFANMTALRAGIKNVRHLSYDVNGSAPEADIRDMEPGNGDVTEFPGWARHYKGTLAKPTGYCSASDGSRLISNMLDAGFKRSDFFYQSAHYGRGEHLCGPHTCGFAQADSTQWDDHGSRRQNIDRTIYQDYVLEPKAKPVDPDAHYSLFDDRKRAMFGGMSERSLVQDYDKWRATQTPTKHPHRARLAWLRVKLRIAYLRLKQLGSPEKYHRAWRIRELNDRANGMRLV